MTKLSGVPAHRSDRPAQVIGHPFFPGYTLELVLDDDDDHRVGFRCDGCELPGAGARYECKRGLGEDVDLHISCALAHTAPVRKIGGNEFVLRQKPAAAPADETTYCDACGGDAVGFVYHCPKLDNDLHPCCADLRESFDLPSISFELHMGAPPRGCAVCTKKKLGVGPRQRKCWTYGSVGGDDPVFLHVACARDLGLGSDISFSTAVSLDVARASERRLAGDFREEAIIPVRAQAVNRLLLQRRGPRRRHFSLRVLGVIVRAVIGVIFGDPTAMIVAVAGALFPTG
ncbi:unnamed protein product [Urochloa humidicola]